MQMRGATTLLAASAAFFAFVSAPPVEAAEFTDLLDAADDLDDGDPDTYDPWDFHLEPSFNFDYSTAQITREAPCVPSDHPSIDESSDQYNPQADGNRRLVRDSERCPEPRIVTNREMLFQGSRSTLDMTLRAGLYKDLELRINIPYVVGSTRGLKYDNDPRRGQSVIDEGNSSVDPSDDRIRNHGEDVFDADTDYSQNRDAYGSALDEYHMYRFFDLGDEYSRYERSGLADPSVGIHWAPWSDYRDDTKATMLIGMDYVMPIAPVQRHDNDAVGEGLHQLQWNIGASKRFDWIEPYFGARYTLPIPATDSLYGQIDGETGGVGSGQVVTNPPHEGMFTIGTEFIPYEDPEAGARYGIDLRFEFGYTSEGRDYTPLFDHMTAPGNDCNNRTIESVQPDFDTDGNLTNPDDVACSWVVQQPSNATPASYDLESDDEYAFTDLMTVDDYGTFSGQIGFYLQPIEYFQFRGVAGLTHHQSHLLTNARTGRDSQRTEDDSVDMSSEYERNPAYNPAYDNSGDRFRVERFNTWHFSVTAALQF